MDEQKYNKFTKVMIPVVIVLFLIVAVLTVMTVKKHYDRVQEERSIAESEAVDAMTVTVTIPEGFTVAQISELFEEKGVCSAKEFLSFVKNPPQDILEMIGLKDVSKKIFALEGYIYPDTYEFYRDEEPREVVLKILDNFKLKVNDNYYLRAEKAGYTMDEILSVAAIIQKEAGIPAENGKVSSVIYNRLNDGMQIQCDVTGNYLEKYVKPYVNSYSEEYENNYDTFKCSAIPAGAICNPGIDCIEAALSPEKTNYYFFVTDSVETTKFYFSETYEEHLANCQIAGYTGY